MGGAFGKIVTSLVNDLIMPLVGIIIGGIDFTTLSITVKDSKIMYGSFIQNVVDFLIVAVCIFFMVKIINRLNNLHKKKEEKKEEPAEVKKSDEVLLLEEIRDLLKKEKNNKKS